MENFVVWADNYTKTSVWSPKRIVMNLVANCDTICRELRELGICGNLKLEHYDTFDKPISLENHQHFHPSMELLVWQLLREMENQHCYSTSACKAPPFFPSLDVFPCPTLPLGARESIERWKIGLWKEVAKRALNAVFFISEMIIIVDAPWKIIYLWIQILQGQNYNFDL